jgi:hypothetical protein
VFLAHNTRLQLISKSSVWQETRSNSAVSGIGSIYCTNSFIMNAALIHDPVRVHTHFILYDNQRLLDLLYRLSGRSLFLLRLSTAIPTTSPIVSLYSSFFDSASTSSPTGLLSTYERLTAPPACSHHGSTKSRIKCPLCAQSNAPRAAARSQRPSMDTRVSLL